MISFVHDSYAAAGAPPARDDDPSIHTRSYVSLLNRVVDKEARTVRFREGGSGYIGLVNDRWGKRACFYREITVPPSRAALDFLSYYRRDLFLTGFISIERMTSTDGSGWRSEITAYLDGMPFYILMVREAVAGRISFIIDDVGYNEKALPEALAVKCPVDFSVLPHLAFTKKTAVTLREKGFEIMLHLPMESQRNPAGMEKGTITAGMAADKVAARIQDDIADVPGVVGINNHMGSKATKDEAVMETVLSEAKSRGIFFVDSMTAGTTATKKAAKKAGIVTGERDVFLDNKKDPKYIKKQIERLKSIALSKKKAIGIGHFYPVTLLTIEKMRPSLEDAGIKIVFVSELIGNKDARSTASDRVQNSK